MKILYINSFYDPYIAGGAEITLKNLVEGMKTKNNDVMVIALWEENTIKKDFVNGIEVIRFPIKNIYLPFKSKQNSIKRNLWHLIETYNPFVISHLESVINDFKPDIVSVHNTQGWSAPVLWKFLRENNIPFVQVLHDQYLLCPTNMYKNGNICQNQCNVCKILRLMYKKNSNYATGLVGVSSFILNKLKNYEYFKEVKTYEVIYNSRNIKNFKYDLNYRKEVNEDMVFGFIGTLAQNKGIELLLEVFKKNKKLNWKLLIAGNGKEEYVSQVQQKYQDNSIKFLGKVHPDEFYPYVDCVVVPSLWEETLGMTVVESFIYGKPVIGSKIGGIPEMINENNGYIFEYNSQDNLYIRMNDFEKNIKFWKENSLEIQKNAKERYDYEKWLNKWVSVYRRYQK